MGDLTIDAIKAKYPDPVVSFPNCKSPAHTECYCVGGAFYQYLVRQRSPGLKMVPGLMRFPTAGELAHALMEAESGLSIELAEEYALAIVMENDAGRFDAAWNVLDRAIAPDPPQ